MGQVVEDPVGLRMNLGLDPEGSGGTAERCGRGREGRGPGAHGRSLLAVVGRPGCRGEQEPGPGGRRKCWG